MRRIRDREKELIKQRWSNIDLDNNGRQKSPNSRGSQTISTRVRFAARMQRLRLWRLRRIRIAGEWIKRWGDYWMAKCVEWERADADR
jgi:hypothetical protein